MRERFCLFMTEILGLEELKGQSFEAMDINFYNIELTGHTVYNIFVNNIPPCDCVVVIYACAGGN